MTPRELGQAVYDAINARDEPALRELFAADVVRHAAGEVGVEPALAAMRGAFAAAPDLRFEVADLVAERDRVALRVTTYAGDEPRSEIHEVFRVADGQVAEIWGAGRPLG